MASRLLQETSLQKRSTKPYQKVDPSQYLLSFLHKNSHHSSWEDNKKLLSQLNVYLQDFICQIAKENSWQSVRFRTCIEGLFLGAGIDTSSLVFSIQFLVAPTEKERVKELLALLEQHTASKKLPLRIVATINETKI